MGEASHPSVGWLDHLAHLTDDPFVLMAIAAELPDQTLALRERAAETTQRIVTALAQRATNDPDLVPSLAQWASNLGVRLSDLGEREAALAAAREAVALYRDLAAQRPDAFRPNLAISLMVLARCLDAVDRQEDGLASNAEAIATLSTLFQRVPAAFADLIGGMARDYLERCEKLGREPDEALLLPVIRVFETLQAGRDAPR